MVIWHLSGDFPDPFNSAKTPVIRSLVDYTAAEFEHFVISLNRVSPSPRHIPGFVSQLLGGDGLAAQFRNFEHGLACAYQAPPKGFLHAMMLRRLAGELMQKTVNSTRPDLIVAHKLTIEGLVAWHMAQALQIPFAVLIQGNTDIRILNARPDLIPSLRRLFHDAATVFTLAPWALEAVEEKLGRREGPSITLPAMTQRDRILPPKPSGNGFVTAFHLKDYRNKNLAGMVKANALLQGRSDDCALDVLGGGSADEAAACKALVSQSPGIRLQGPIDHAQIPERFNAAIGFVLPSFRESFGLVFVESLLAGTPIIYPRGRAVAGHFDDLPFAIAVDPRSPHEIAGAMERLSANELEIKQALADWQMSGAAKRFQRESIARSFAFGLQQAVRNLRPV